MALPIFGDDKDNTLKGGNGADMLFGAGGKDALSGGYGADFLSGDDGDDRLFGQENNDNLDGGVGRDSLDGGSGRDALTGGADADTLKGGQGDDSVLATNLSDLKGDVIDGGDGIDTLQLFVDDATQAIKLDAQDPLKTTKLGEAKSITGIEQYSVYSGSGADQLTGYQLNDVFNAGGGNDTLSGLGGFDFLDGGSGKDKLYGGNGVDYLLGGTGDDLVSGGNGGDIADGGAGKDKVEGGNGNDYLGGGADEDNVLGGSGDDSLYSDASALGGGGDDGDDGAGDGGKVAAFAAEPPFEEDIVYSEDDGTARDTLDGGTGSDTVYMGIGDKGTGGGSSGNTDRAAEVDTLHVNFSESAKAESFTFSTGSQTAKNGASWTGFEQLGFLGGSGADKVTGGAMRDTLDGGEGSDTVEGANGDDVLVDSAGADKLYGDGGRDSFHVAKEGGGKDLFHGGSSTDTVFLGEEVEISAYLDLGNQKNNGGLVQGDSFSSIEIFVGTDLDDTLLGAKGNDIFFGGEEDDLLKGNDGNDYLNGGAGSDLIASGKGDDTIALNYGEEVFGWEGDRIADFARGDDKLEISLFEFGLGTAKDFKLVVGEDPGAKAGASTFLFDTETHRLWWDADGTGSEYDPMLIATLDKLSTLSTGDFVFV